MKNDGDEEFAFMSTVSGLAGLVTGVVLIFIGTPLLGAVALVFGLFQVGWSLRPGK